ncbi:MAG: hypothetical protein ABFD69_16785 [Candidatus Sumerlaeia bacterium]
MGFDYFAKTQCPIQAPRDNTEFVQRAKVGAYAGQIGYTLSRQQGPEREAMLSKTMTLPFPVKTLMGASAELTFAELVETWQRIERKSKPICEKCPVNVKGEALGCWGAISYPISQACEHWIIDHFNPPEPGPSYLLHHIREAGITGERLDNGRAELNVHEDGGYIPVLLPPGPAEKIVEGERITSSMILEYLIGCQPYLINQTLLGLLTEFNAVDLDPVSRMLMFGGMFTGGQGAEELKNLRFMLTDSPEDDRSIAQFKRFLKTCHAALVNKRKLSVDG